MLKPFVNEPMQNFNDPAVAEDFKQSMQKVEKNLGQYYPLIIGGEKIKTEEEITSINPSNKEEVIGRTAKASVAEAQQAIDSAVEALPGWSSIAPEDRARCLIKTAAILRRRKNEFSSWLVYEAGKNWAEADGDTAEAIDFLEYYGREMIRIAQGQSLTTIDGEDNELVYIPLGVGAIIPPWNFPLAIMAGMTAAAIVAGNTVVLKPASNTPVIAAKFMEILEDAGLPAGVVNFIPGSGSSVGDFLVTSPQINFINFTGSKEVGLRINELAAKTPPGQPFIKRVALELGGKDAIVVDSSADLPEAAAAIVASAFGFQGQKCSACSRAIIVEDVYDQVVSMVKEQAEKLILGPAKDNCAAGPVIDESSLAKIKSYIEIGQKEGKLILGGETAEELGGFYVKPTIFTDVAPQAAIAQEEIFGPVLAIIKADNFTHALEIANDTEYGLTGSVYAREREKLVQARDFQVGNLYFNRKCTGALVGVHPFGGFKLSGTDSKAGGPDYLKHFMLPKVITEKY